MVGVCDIFSDDNKVLFIFVQLARNMAKITYVVSSTVAAIGPLQ